MIWNKITSVQEVDALIARSHEVPCVIFKHSTRCNISAIAQMRLEDDWDFPADALEPYYLDLIAYRPVSQYIAEVFSVHHESPQVLLIGQGECTYDAAHLDITVAELQEALATSEV
jgi:bacillithiol system protein YtxJ